MRIEADRHDVSELTLLLTPTEAQEVVRTLHTLLAVVPSKQLVSENEVDDAPSPQEGGMRIVRLVVYADPETERAHDVRLGESS